MTLIEYKAVHIAFRLMLQKKRAELLEHAIALAKIVFGIVPGIDTEWREANCGLLTESVERVGSTRGAAIRLRNKERITAAVIPSAPFRKIGLIDIRRVDIDCIAGSFPYVHDTRLRTTAGVIARCRRTGSIVRRIAFTSWKIAVFAPMPRASDSTCGSPQSRLRAALCSNALIAMM
jgi:hypothetical protein